MHITHYIPSGTPLAPVITDAKLLEEDSGGNKTYDLMFTWEIKREDLKPIDSFFGAITASTIQRETGVIAREQREDNTDLTYNFVVDGSTTEYTVVDVIYTEEYTVQVCSRNRQGFNCSTRVAFDRETLLASIGRSESHDNDDGVAVGIAIAVVIAVLFVIIILIIACFCFICTHWTSYHPEGKGVL